MNKLIETTAAITAIGKYFNTLAGTGYTGHESAGIPKAIEDILNALPEFPAVPLEVHEKMKREISERLIPKHPKRGTPPSLLRCPNCSYFAGGKLNGESKESLIHLFCPKCGQALTLENMPQEDTENSVVFNDFMKKSEVS